MKNSVIDLKRLKQMTAIYIHADGDSPEEDALNKITQYATEHEIIKNKNAQLFGRNTYPTDAPEPHGYEYYLTIDKNQLTSDVSIREIKGGLYAVKEVQDLCNLTEGWKELFAWIASKEYSTVGLSKGEFGWVNNAYEELVNWQENKPPVEWIFRLWVQLKE